MSTFKNSLFKIYNRTDLNEAEMSAMICEIFRAGLPMRRSALSWGR